MLPVLQEHKEAQRNSANDVSSIKQRQVLQGKKLWLMYSPDDISMERLFEQAPFHTHPVGYEGASETTLEPLGSLNPWRGKKVKTTFPRHVCPRLLTYFAESHLFQEPSEGSSHSQPAS